MQDQETKLVDFETAKAEVESWLKYKKLPDSFIAKRKGQIDVLAEAIVDGALTYNSESHEFTQQLKFPITSGDKPFLTLVFKPRLTQEQINNRTKNVMPTDLDGRIKAYLGALTNVPEAVISKIDSADLAICEAIVNFFM